MANTLNDEEYDKIKQKCIISFNKVPKDSIAFDMNRVDKQTRVRLLTDESYIAETKCILAEMYAKDLTTLQGIISDTYNKTDKDPTANMLKALQMRNELLYQNLAVNADDTNALNITMIELSREDFEKMETVEVHIEGSNVANTTKEENTPTIQRTQF